MHGGPHNVSLLDWFVPERARSEPSDLLLARNYVVTQFIGVMIFLIIAVALLQHDDLPLEADILLAVFGLCWLCLPLLYRWTENLQLCALLCVQAIAVLSLTASYFYGGMSSPFLPWMLVSLLIGFFYLFDKPRPVLTVFALNIAAFTLAGISFGFPQRIEPDGLGSVGWISIVSATFFIGWMAIFYSKVITKKYDLELEAERHRETAERLRFAKDLADEASRTRSIFLAKMSHELRTPLNAVIGYSELLIETASDTGKNASNLVDLERINASGKHLLALVAEVLDLTKIEANQIDVKYQVVDLAALVDEVVATAQPLIESGNNKFVVKRMGRLKNICIDDTKLRQVMLNLLSNAAKFTKGGKVTLMVQQQARQGSDWVTIQVSDTGMGIAEEDLAKIFLNYQQASASISSKFGGTGLGLPVTEHLCSLMGGRISATSEVGVGSTFVIHVPGSLHGDPHESGPLTDDRNQPALAN